MKDRIEQANQYIQDNKDKVNPYYRHSYHFMAPVGWINDPNGFSMYKGEYHLFYQYHPYGTTWGPMHWGHAKSTDLVKWEHLPVAVAPLEDGPEGGAAFSGSAIEHDGKHYVMYTENWPGRQVQSIAVSEDGVNYVPYENNPVIDSSQLPEGVVKADFRDPKVWKHGDTFYVVIGLRNNDSSGQIVLYKSADLCNWEFVNTICQSNNEIGKMWECPDLFDLDGHDVLMMSPQLLETRGDQFYNVNSTAYFIGKLDYEKGHYDYSVYDEIDYGFDFYAPQTLIDEKGRRIMVAWKEMWERNMPSNTLGHNWAGAMTFPRVVNVVNNQLIQMPVEEIKNYRQDEVVVNETFTGSKTFDGISGQVCELEIEFDAKEATAFGLKIFKGKDQETVLYYDKNEAKFILDRTKNGQEIKGNKDFEPNTNIRRTSVELVDNQLKLRLLLDRSCVEAFIQDGVRAMAANVYPDVDSDTIEFFADKEVTVSVKKWNLSL